MAMLDASTAILSALARYQNSIIQVDTSVIIAKADQVSGAISNMERTFEELQRIVIGTNSYWIGEAADCHRKMFNDEKDDIVKILNRLKEHPSDLKLIAAGYDNTEKKLENINQQLRNDYL